MTDTRHRSLAGLMSACLALIGSLLASASVAQQTRSGGDGTIYVTNYRDSLQIIEESSFRVTREIPLDLGQPLALVLSPDRSHLYVHSVYPDRFAVVDRESEAVVGRFSLDGKRQNIHPYAPLVIDPTESYALLVTKTVEKKRDRFEIGEPTIVRFDLETHRSEEIPWPGGIQREFVDMAISPDGKHVVFMSDDIIVLDAVSFEEVDRWQYDGALGPGVGNLRFSFQPDLHERPGFLTGLFRATDSVQNRELMGVARIDLAAHEVDYFVTGPDEPSLGESIDQTGAFVLAPDLRTAYGLLQEPGRYEVWSFDLEGRRLARRTSFDGRTRMQMVVSSNGELIYVFGAGPTIDVYEAASFDYLRTVELAADMTSLLLVPPARPTSGG